MYDEQHALSKSMLIFVQYKLYLFRDWSLHVLCLISTSKYII